MNPTDSDEYSNPSGYYEDGELDSDGTVKLFIGQVSRPIIKNV